MVDPEWISVIRSNQPNRFIINIGHREALNIAVKKLQAMLLLDPDSISSVSPETTRFFMHHQWSLIEKSMFVSNNHHSYGRLLYMGHSNHGC